MSACTVELAVPIREPQPQPRTWASDCSLSVAYDLPDPTGTHPGVSILFMHLRLLTAAHRTLIPI